MIWTVTYRGKDGLRESMEVESDSRESLFAELRKRGVSAISVEQGGLHVKSRKCVASRSRQSRPSLIGRGIWLGVAAGLLVVVGVALSAWWFHPETHSDNPTGTVVERKPKIPKSRPTSAQNPNASAPAAEPAKSEKTHFGVPESEWAKLSHEQKVALAQAAYDEKASKIDSTYLERKKAHDLELANRPFKHTSENIIANVLALRPGDSVLMGDFHPTLESDFLESLNEPITFSENDDENTRQLKREMIELKPQIKALMDKGYSLAEILDDTRKSIAKIQDLERNLRKELDEIKRTATSVADVESFIEAANKMMQDAGVSTFTYPLTKGAIKKIQINAEREKANENK